MPSKFFCYVDESGQDTRGILFIVSVVIAQAETDELRRICEGIEQVSRKRKRKWSKSTYARKRAYIERVVGNVFFKGKLNFAVYRNALDYTGLTVRTIARALDAMGEADYKATILIDGLPRVLEQAVGLQLRRSGIPAKKVRGVKRDENDALIRLADAVCGLVRGAIDGEPTLQTLLGKGIQTGVLRDLSEK